MTMITKHMLPIAAALAVAASPAVASAAPQVTARLDTPEVEIGRAAQLAVTVSGDGGGAPRLPRVPGLFIQPAGSSQQLTITNGAIDQRMTYHYQVVPQRAGTYTVGPIAVGGTQAAPLRLTARPPGARSRGGRSAQNQGRAPRTTTVEEPRGRRAFLVVDADQTDLVVGESTPVTVRAYVKAGTSGTITGAPELSSDAFAIHDLVEGAQQGRAEIRGTPYATLTWRGNMTALLPGEHEVGASVPATLEWRELVRTEQEDPFAGHRSLLDRFMNDPRFGSVFDDPFFSSSPFSSRGGGASSGMGSFFTTSWGPPHTARVSLEDELGTVTVREPPEEGRPDDWDGAVGRFEVSADATPTTVRAGEPITLRLRVRGDGSFDRVHHALMPEDAEGLRVYPVTEDGRSGEKVFEQSIVPTEAGPLTLPSLSLSFYDPERGAYATVRTEPIAIDVQPSADGEAPVRDLDAAVGPSAEGFAPNAVTPGAFVGSLRPLPEHPWPWLAGLLAMGLALGAAVALGRRDPEAAASRRTTRRARRDRRAAERRMKEAAERGDAAGFFLAARAVIQRRLGEAWGMAPDAVTLAEAEDRLAEVPAAIRGVLERADAMEFGAAVPSDEDPSEWRARVERALSEEIDR